MNRIALRSAVALAAAFMMTPAIAASAWRPLPGFDQPVISEATEPCWHQGELHVVGWTHETTEDGQRPTGMALWARRDGAWRAVRSLEGQQPMMLASDGNELAVVTRRRLHRLQAGRWREEDIAPLPGRAVGMVLWDGRVVAGGEIGRKGARGMPCVVAWDGTEWSPLGGGVGGVPRPRVQAMATNADGIWVAGRFEIAGDAPAGNVARWDGSGWDALGGGVDGEVVALAAHDGGIAVAGTFTRAGDAACGGLAIWREGDWQALPDLAAPARTSSAEACPLPSVTSLASVREGLLALGRFSFIDPDGEEVRDAAVLVDGRWRRWRHAQEVFGDGLHPAWNTLPRFRILSFARVFGEGDRGRVAIRGEGPRSFDLVADVDGFREAPVQWARHPRLGAGDYAGLATWGDDLLLYGADYIGPWRVGGLGRLGQDRWEPLGDWPGPDGRGGGAVQSVAEWRGQLVVAGVLDAPVAGYVAAFDGHKWNDLAGGVPVDSVTTAQVLPRRRDLVVVTDRHGLGSRPEVRFSSWDGSEWSPIPAPPRLVGTSTQWQAIAADDTIWVLGPVPVPRDDRGFQLCMPGLLALVDTTWTFLGLDDGKWPSRIAHWNGALHGLVGDLGGSIRTLARWNGRDWQPTGAPALPADESSGGLRVLPDGRLLICGKTRSWCLDEAGGWAPWPGLPVGEHKDVALAGGSLYRLDAGHTGMTERWDGRLPQPAPHLRPASALAKPWRRPGLVRQPDLPPLTDCAPADTICGWYLWDHGGDREPVRMRPRGDGDIEIAGDETSLSWRFAAQSPCWYRLAGRTRSRSGTPRIGLRVEGQPWDAGASHEITLDAMEPGPPQFELMVPARVGCATGHVVLQVNHDAMRIEALRLESGPHLFADALERLLAQVGALARPRHEAGAAVPAQLSAALAEAAANAFTRAEADSLAMTMVAGLGDDRLWVNDYDGLLGDRILPGVQKLESGEHFYEAPRSTLPCERLPVGVTAWLDGDLACAGSEGSRTWRADDHFAAPFAAGLAARGLILDLREPSSRRADTSAGIVETLRTLGVRNLRWARVRDRDGRTHAWRDTRPRKGETRPVMGRDDLPVVVLVSARTDRGRALLAEALSRLDNVTLIGEPTAPLPAVDAAIAIPWARWKLMVPSGTWEAPGGRVLTGSIVEPDIAWPAADTDGLIAQARAVVDAFARGRSGR